MITRRQWVGSARVLQVLNLIGPEGPIAPGRNPRGGNPGRNPREETRAGTSGRKPQGGQEVSGPQAPQHHSTTGPTAPQHHRPHSTTAPQVPTATAHSVLTASLLSHHPSYCLSPFNFHIKHSKHKRKTMRN